jgi:hypothetical protein
MSRHNRMPQVRVLHIYQNIHNSMLRNYRLLNTQFVMLRGSMLAMSGYRIQSD